MERPAKCFPSDFGLMYALSLDKSLSLTMSAPFLIKWSRSPLLHAAVRVSGILLCKRPAVVSWRDQWQPLYGLRKFRLKNVPQSAFHWGWAAPVSDVWNTQYHFGSHIWFSGSITGNSVTPGCRILKRLWKISAEGPVLLIRHPPVTPLSFKDRNCGSESGREQKGTIEQASFPGNRHIPSSSPDPKLMQKGDAYWGSMRQGRGQHLACSLLSPSIGSNMRMWSTLILKTNRVACV